MSRRLLLSYLTVTLVVLLLLEIPLAVFYSQRELDRFTTGLERDATVIAAIYEDDLETGRPLDPYAANSYDAKTGARVVVVDSRGVSLVDTQDAVPRDFSTRPEIVTALNGQRSSGKRHSSTLGTDLVFVALPVSSSGTVHGAVRVTLDTSLVDRDVHRFWFSLVAIALVVLGVIALVGWAIARSVTLPIRRLQRDAARFASGDLVARDGASGGPTELRELSDTMSHMAERLAELLDEQRSFVADASHQLRTPLTALRLRLENVQARLAAADSVGEAADIESAIDETSRLAALVTDLLQLARADQRQETTIVDLSHLTAERVDTWSAVAEMGGVALALSGAEATVLVRATVGAVEQILDNTFDNALSVSPAGATVTVTIERDGPIARLIVADRGPGLSDGDKAKATRRFWRGSTGTPGTGLGLAIANALARGCGGTLTLADTPEGGLSVVLTLPAAG